MAGRGAVFLLYHYFRPDDVISARLFSDLAEDLTEAGFDVTAVPSIRSCHGPSVRLAKGESWSGGTIRRVWRPAWPQHKTAGRFGNALFMLLGWTWIAATMPRKRGEVMVVGTDPVLGVLIAITWRLFRPRSRIIHWCHDLYPNAAVADGMISENAPWVRVLKWMLRIAYRRCDVLADLGICMRQRLQEAAGEGAAADTESIASADSETSRGDGRVNQPRLLRDGREVRSDAGESIAADWWSGRYATLVPWSLIEPESVVEPNATTRHELFGNHRLGLLYSGNFGRAHCFESMIALARRLRGDDVGVCFAGRGMRLQSVRAEMTDADMNIRFAGFADESELADRLAAADIHLVTLRSQWTGTVVPSKFFGALAAGRPVIFAGDPNSAIAQWIDQYQIGWVLTEKTIDELAESIPKLAGNLDSMLEMRQRCFDIYHREFSRRVQVDRWQRVLTGERYQPVRGERWLLGKRREKATRKAVAASV